MYNFHLEIKFLDNEYWWGGAVDEGIFMPYINNYPLADLNDNNFGNQATSFFISSKLSDGILLWFTVWFPIVWPSSIIFCTISQVYLI